MHTDREEDSDFLEKLRQSLRAVYGFRGGLELNWTTGPSAEIRLTVTEESGSNLNAAFLRAYPSGSWVRAGNFADEPPVLLVGRRALDWTDPILAGPSGIDAMAAVVRILPSIPRALRLRWRFVPAPTSPRTGLEYRPRLEPIVAPPGTRIEPLVEVERERRDRTIRRWLAPAWMASVEILGARYAEKEASRVAEVVRASFRTYRGEAFSFRPPLRLLGPARPSFLLAEEDLLAVLPHPGLAIDAIGGGPGPKHPTAIVLRGRLPDPELEIPFPRHEGRHLLILGETGMGKTRFLLQLALAAAGDATLVLFDPIGDTARRFIDRLPGDARRRVVLVSARESPVGLNALATPGPPQPSADDSGAAGRSELLNALARVRRSRYESSSFWGPRIAEVLAVAIDVAAHLPQGTLDDCEQLLSNLGGRRGPVPAEFRAEIEELWERARSRPQELEGSRRLLREIVRNPTLHRLLCEPHPRWSLAEGIERGSIIVLSGDGPAVGESTARHLLAIYLALLWPQLLAHRGRTKTVLLLDEVEWYAHESLAEILRLGRRVNVHCWMTAQDLASFEPPIRATILTNAADLIAFRTSPDDARELGRWATGIPPMELLRLRAGSAVAFLGKGHRVVPFTAEESAARPDFGGWASAVAQSLRFVVPKAPSSPSAGGSARRSALLILAEAARQSSNAEVVVPVDELRQSVDPDGTAIRFLGDELRRTGILRASERENGRTIWLLRCDPGQLDSALSPTDAEREIASGRWEQIARRRRASTAG